MNPPEIQDFILRHSNLFWYTPENKKPEISLEFLVETILNYGTMNDVRNLIRILGIKETADIFFASINKHRKRISNGESH